MQDKVFNEITLTNLSAENGVDKLIEYMDKLFKKMNFQKYMNVLLNLNVIKKNDALQLYSNNRKLVLTAVDYNKVNTLFDQMKNALQKFHGQQTIPTSSAPIKIEAAVKKTS